MRGPLKQDTRVLALMGPRDPSAVSATGLRTRGAEPTCEAPEAKEGAPKRAAAAAGGGGPGRARPRGGEEAAWSRLVAVAPGQKFHFLGVSGKPLDFPKS